MAEFRDKSGNVWAVRLDVPTVEAIKAELGVNLTGLDSDPLLPLRNDVSLLVDAFCIIAQDQIRQRGLSAMQLAKLIPYPPAAILRAITEAVVDLFPSTRAEFVRETLAAFEQSHSVMTAVLRDRAHEIVNADEKPLSRKDRRHLSEALDALFPAAN